MNTKKKFLAILLSAIVLVTVATIMILMQHTTKTISSGVPWGGEFDPLLTPSKQNAFDANKLYVWYNGNFYTEADPNDFDYGYSGNKSGAITGVGGTINSYLKAYAIVTKGQFIEFVAKKSSDLENLNTLIGTAAEPNLNTVWINLKGATVIPGMIESHMHYISEGLRASEIDIFYKQKADVIAAVKIEAERLHNTGADPNDTWIVSQGWANIIGGDWDSNRHPDAVSNWPTRWELDEVSLGYPVALTHTSGHAAWYNTKALEMGNNRAYLASLAVRKTDRTPVEKILVEMGLIDWDKAPHYYPDPSGNVALLLSGDGRFTGVLQGNSMRLVSVPGESAAQSRAALYAAQQICFSYGITTIMDAGSGMGTFDMFDNAYQGKLQGFEGNPLKIRVYLEIAHGDKAKIDQQFRNRMKNERRGDSNGRLIGEYNNRFTVRASKLLIDGAFGGQNAAMLAPYTNNLNTTGTMYVTDEVIRDYLERNIRASWQTSVHVIGDAAVRKYNDYYEELKNKLVLEGKRNLVTNDRQRAEHYQIASLGVKDLLVNGVWTNSGINDIQRSVDLGMVFSMQFTHATSDLTNAENLAGQDRIHGAYAWREVIDRGGIIAQGTDATVELLNPYHGLYAGVTRVSRAGGVGRAGPNQAVIDEDRARFKADFIPGTKNFTAESGWYANQRLTRAEALHYSTWGGAYANFEEGFKGALRKGYLADFVVIDRDYFDDTSCSDLDIKEINAVMTILGGEIVYTMERPEIVTTHVAAITIGENYSSQLFAKGTENFLWSIVSKDKELSWLSINQYSGILEGTPAGRSGTFKVTVKAENYLGSDTKVLTLLVRPSAP